MQYAWFTTRLLHRNPRRLGALLLAGKTIVVATTEGFLYAFDLEGSLLWTYPPTQPVEAGFHSAPALAGDTVLVVDGDGLLHAVSL